MKNIEVEPDYRNFLCCPLTGKKTFYDNGQPTVSTLRGDWCHVHDEPINWAEDLKPLQQKCLAAHEAAKDVLDITAILRSCEPVTQVAFEITTGRMACDPVWDQERTLLELNSPDEPGEH